MCGVFAVIDKRNKIRRADAERALLAMQRRGPDGQGIWYSLPANTCLGHVRRSIIDLEGGEQPLTNEDNTIVAVVQGEFYNFEQIRNDLQNRGHIFKTLSDSEILIHLYEESGFQALTSLNGEFAFVLWDDRKKQLWAVRDRFGTKSLHYYYKDSVLVFATEISALKAYGLPLVWDEQKLLIALRLPGGINNGLNKDLQQLAPGHWLSFGSAGLRIERYFRPEADSISTNSQMELEQESAALLKAAVKTRLRADVPIGCYLSGGIDSTSVYCLASEYLDQELPAFTVAFGDHNFEEVQRAHLITKGKSLIIVSASELEQSKVFVQTVRAGETLCLNGHGPARYLLSRAVQNAGLRVVLGGEGADEAFGGYWFLSSALRKESFWSRFKCLKPPFQPALLKQSPLLWFILRSSGLPQRVAVELEQHQKMLLGLCRPINKRDHTFDPLYSFLCSVHWRQELRKLQPARQLLGLWLRSIFPAYNLAAERLDMAHAVEVRLPYLDKFLWEVLARNRVELFMDGKKTLLRKIVSNRLSDTLLHAPKQPFIAPRLTPNSPYFPIFDELLNSSELKDLPLLDSRKVLAWWRNLKSLKQLPFVAESVLFQICSLVVLQECWD